MYKAIILCVISIMNVNNGQSRIIQPSTSSTNQNLERNSVAFDFVTREDWSAAPPKLVEHFRGPAPYVIIHHSYIPGVCKTRKECDGAMKSMQKFHQDERGWNDIGYSFAVGGDGAVYQGRGFNVIGAHAPKYNDKSVGICMIGDWTSELPPQQMLDAVQALIEFGVQNGKIKSDYKLLGHRQVRETECPGQRLFDEIKTWDHWVESP